MKLLIDPHGDDSVLFASFTIQKERPDLVLVVFDSYIQSARGAKGCEASIRQFETLEAIGELYGELGHVGFLGYRDDWISGTPSPTEIDNAIEMAIGRGPVEELWAPAYEEGGHEQHNLVARACDAFAGSCTVHRYLTYTRGGGKSRSGYFCGRFDRAVEVQPQSGDDIARKLRALSCFKSQMQLDSRIGCSEWFYGNDLREYALLTPSQTGEKP